MNYTRSFVIGSSLPVFLIFFLTIGSIDDTTKNYSYKKYTIITPLYFGLVNIVSTYISNKYNISLKKRLFYTSLLSGLFVSIYGRLQKSYNFTKQEWIMHNLISFIYHFITWYLIIYFIEKNI